MKLKENMIQNFEMHSYGLENIAMCQEVCRILQKWIELIQIAQGYTNELPPVKYHVVVFKRSQDF